MFQKGQILITNQTANITEIDIEGIIGVPEHEQFEQDDDRIATYDKFREVLEQIKALETPEVIVNIRSTGGSVNDALLIYESLTGLRSRIITRCYGYVASAATIIAQAGSVGSREISANSLYLVHRSVCTIEGNRQELTESTTMLEKTDLRIAELYAARSGRPAKEFLELMDENNGNGKWLAPEEVIEFGLADTIIGAQAWSKSPEAGMKKKSRLRLPFRVSNKRRTAMRTAAGRTGRSEKTTTGTPIHKVLAELDRKDEIISGLRNRLATLSAMNERLSALPTMTMPKEDPGAGGYMRSPNDNAYQEDLKRFKY